MLKKNIAIAAAFLSVLLVGGTALAAKPTSSSLSLVVVSSDEIAAASLGPAHGGKITFDVRTTQTDRPFVNVQCVQNGSWVYDGWHGFFESYVPEPLFTLASDYWTGGAADCTARLVFWNKSGKLQTLSTLDFRVSA